MKIVFVVGPTATGKSALALAAAEKFSGEIVNADSVQVYREVDIGTAKPTPEERQRCPHHLFDFVPAGGTYTAGDYRRDARRIIAEAESRKVPVLFFVGGSGFYIRALVQGMYELPAPQKEQRERVKKQLQKIGWEEAYRELQEKDPEYALKVSPNDHYRVARAFEIMATGKTVTEVKKQQTESPLQRESHFYALEMEREQLRHRVQQRVEKMFDQGWVAEVESLRERGWSEWEPMRSVGYLEVQRHLEGELGWEEMKTAIVTSTMQLAKKQRTWFRNQVPTVWLSGSLEENLEKMGEVLTA